MPKSAVNSKLFNEFANTENGPIQPCKLAATNPFVHTPSTTNGGLVAFQYPQQLKRCCSSDWVAVGWRPHTVARLARVLRVWNQTSRPRRRVKVAQATTA